MKKVVFLGSKEVGFAAFEHLIRNSSTLGIALIGVLSNDRKISSTTPSILELAAQNTIPIIPTLNDLLDLESFDFLISVQYHEILLQKHISCAKELAINLHMAPLPEYRGCNQFSFAIIDGAKEFGTTLHVMEAGIDSGDLMFENRFPIEKEETVHSLHQKTTSSSISLFINSIENLINGHYFRIEQSSLYPMRAHNFHLRSEVNNIKKIDSNWPDEKIDRYVRATYFPPFPPPFTIINGNKIELSLNWRNEIPH
ncbi:MAG: methionyl-tRNA formyltransferase [Salibacteraceae bacterium]|jgi:methionyl-tRNA formyltransferase